MRVVTNLKNIAYFGQRATILTLQRLCTAPSRPINGVIGKWACAVRFGLQLSRCVELDRTVSTTRNSEGSNQIAAMLKPWSRCAPEFTFTG
jgi:hypothetical protein